jgi:hypothetical protein
VILVHMLCAAVGLVAAGLLGCSLGRDRERRMLLSPVVLGSGERRVGDYEAQLRKAQGLRRLHPDPENAPHVRLARVIR